MTVRRPTGLNQLRLRHATPLATATAAKVAKHAKYDEACERENLTMVPFALESYVAQGQEGASASHQVSRCIGGAHCRGLPATCVVCTLVALQCGNADVAARGVQAMRAHQMADQQRPHWQRPPEICARVPSTRCSILQP